ncbi:protein suppressor of sable isoform X2 [Sitophilus oryzae]|uniref:Protein suppressor of sable isoform X2 n=1 Tax=Sitophilus oryzae TaxID=7048 RepID=A0A6J2XTT4_SITOR|nr:protein suppressor of sable isoform X2 [Sitophilus oryzae]
MALVCDIKSDADSGKPSNQEEQDIEDGEITDDDEETPLQFEPPNPEPSVPPPIIPNVPPAIPGIPPVSKKSPTRDSKEVVKDRPPDKERSGDERDKVPEERIEKDRKDRRGREGGKGHRHMTEAEKSILHLRKREKIMREREKWEKQHRKDVDPADGFDDDFAKNIEKTLATILNKKEKEAAALSAGEEVKEEERRGKKRKKHDKEKDRAKKNKRLNDSPRPDFEENDMMNMRSGSPDAEFRLLQALPMSQQGRNLSKSEDSASDGSAGEREERMRRRATKNRRKKEAKERNRREREQRRLDQAAKNHPLQDSQGVCVFYMQGKCQKNDCPYSHEVTPPMKLELCKFYLMDCCAKGEKCSYMHSEFPCKFYHTGLLCSQGDNCKFAHGQALSDGLKQILFKHIETAPRDILGGFPRLSREEALGLINQTQQKLLQGENGDQTTSNQPSNFGNSPTQTEYGNSQNSTLMYGNRYPNFEERDSEKDTKDIKVPKNNRTKQSRWQQDSDNKSGGNFYQKNYQNYGSDQDMRISSNGDIDMRTLPTIPAVPSTIGHSSQDSNVDQFHRDISLSNINDVDIRSNAMDFTKDIDIRQPIPKYPASMDVDIRPVQKNYEDKQQTDTEDELQIDTEEDKKDNSVQNKFELPQATKDLLARINANQKDNSIAENTLSQDSTNELDNFDMDQNIDDWYSDDDDDDNRLTIKVEEDENVKRDRHDSVGNGPEKESQSLEESQNSNIHSLPSNITSKTADIVGKLGDLSKIDISLEVTKLLTSMSKSRSQTSQDSDVTEQTNSQQSDISGSGSLQDPRNVSRQDPRLSSSTSQEATVLRQDPRLMNLDPRQRPRQSSTDSQGKEKNKSDKVSIYEQGGLDMKKAALEIDNDEFKASLRPDIDLRNLALPFKGMQNYTPATEVDASINSHLPMIWKVHVVDIPRPDYTGLKLSISDAEKTGDPRLRKIFRLSIDEKDSPMSPKASPKQSAGTRADPRLRKMEEKSQEMQLNPQMSYTQQLNMLQSSQFYQSLTSNQKLMLNQELSSRFDQAGGSGIHDPVLNSLLSNLNILPQQQITTTASSQLAPSATNLGAALSILASVSKMNPMLSSQAAPLIGQQGLLGAAPGIPNIPPQMSQDYPINFDPRNGGLLGNAPTGGFRPQFGAVDQSYNSGYNNDDFYGGGYDDQQGGPPNQMGGPAGGKMGGPQGGGNFRQGGRGYNNRDGRRRGNRNFGGRGGNRNFKRGGGRGDRDGRDRERDRDGGPGGGRPMRGRPRSPS